MSVNPPPSPNVNRFNNLYWISADDGLTIGVGDLRYLKFPNAQGTETLLTTNVNGILTSNSETRQVDTANSANSRLKQNNLTLTLDAGYNKTNTAFNINCNNSGGVPTQVFNMSALAINTGGQQFTFNSLLPPISSQTIPALTDSSSLMPTTAWIQAAIGLYGGFQQSLIHKDKDYDYDRISTKSLTNIFGSGATGASFAGSVNNSVMGVTISNGADIYLYLPIGSGNPPSYSFTGAAFAPQSINFSADGQYGLLTNDSGGVNSCEIFLWNGKDIQASGAPFQTWYDTALSANGQFMLASEISGSSTCYVSNDYGTSFVGTGSVGVFYNCAVSATGEYMITLSQYDNVYISKDFGKNWKDFLGARAWYNCCISANGQYMIVQANDNGNPDRCFVSSDFGINWTDIGSEVWTCCCMTDSGRFQVAFHSGGGYYISLNFGRTWQGGFGGINFDTGSKPKFTNDDKYIVGNVGGTPQYIEFVTIW
jgi:hypothetical protein